MISLRSRKNCLAVIVFFFSMFSLSARKAFSADSYSDISWTRIHDGTDYFYSSKDRVHIIRINLENPKLKVVAFPCPEYADSVSSAGFLEGMLINKFAKQLNAHIAINTSPYWMKTERETYPEKNLKILGVHVSEKMKFSKPIEKYPALILSKNFSGISARIVENQRAEDFVDSDYAFGGFFQILKDGEKLSFSTETFDSRTAVGISKDGRELIILSCRKTPGLSYQNCQEIFLKLGITDAIEFDGGSSTSLSIKSKIKNVWFQTSWRLTPSFMGFLFDD